MSVGTVAILERLITENAVRSEADGSSPVHIAAESGYLDVVKYLLEVAEPTADANIANNKGYTPLQFAACNGRVEVVKYLIGTAGIEIDKADIWGKTALYKTCFKGYLDIVECLCKEGADINKATIGGYTPLHRAAGYGHVAIVEFLIGRPGININKTDKEGNTALYCAAVRLCNNRSDNMETVHLISSVHFLISSGGHLSKSVKITLESFNDLVAMRHFLAARNILELSQSLEYLCCNWYTKMFKRLVCDGNRRTFPSDLCDVRSVMSCALQVDNTNIVIFLLELGVSLDVAQSSVYWEQCTLKELYSDIAREREKYPIQAAIRREIHEYELLEVIRSHESSCCSVDYFEQTPFNVSIACKASSMVSTEILRRSCNLMLEGRNFLLRCRVLPRHGYNSFRLHVAGISSGKVYYECTILSTSILWVSIGVISLNWQPVVSVSKYGVGIDDKGVGIDGKAEKIYMNNFPKKIDMKAPSWSAGTVVGVHIDMDSKVVGFSIDGTLVASNIPIESLGRSVVPAMTISDMHVELNFGQLPLKHKPLDFVSIMEHCKSYNESIQPGKIEYFDHNTCTWTAKHGFLGEYFDDWFAAVQNDKLTPIIEDVLKSCQRDLKKVTDLAFRTDAQGRRAVDIASANNREVIAKYIFFLGRYEFKSVIPEHKSDTCVVMIAEDCQTNRQVAIKFMKDVHNYNQEKESRRCLDDKRFVLPLLECYNDEDNVFKDDFIRLQVFSDYNFCVIMPAADRNLQQIINQERIAGMDWTIVKKIFREIVECVSYFHSKRVIHGDLKPLNIMRTREGNIVLIDMDASTSLESVDSTSSNTGYLGTKVSSGYIPPEMVYTDESQTAVEQPCSPTVHIKYYNCGSNPPFEPVLASEQTDMWSLGVILYHLCTGETLFHTNASDNTDHEELLHLYEWNDDFKGKKLSKITDKHARNLVSRLLSKGQERRPLIHQVLAHPFLSGKTVVRMAGDEANNDIFLSYRVDSDLLHVKLLYEYLTARGKKVWWDKKCLESGKKWEEGFCEGLLDSRAFVCILSKQAINHPDIPWQNFGKLSENSSCDNVLLEHRLALELQQLGLLDFIYPIFIGNPKGPCNADPLSPAPEYEAWERGNLPNVPSTHVKQVEEKLVHHMESMALGMPLETNKTVKDVLGGITAHMGFKLEGEGVQAFEKAVNAIVDMLESKVEVQESEVNVVVKNESLPIDEINSLKAEIELNKVDNARKDDVIAQRDAEIARLRALLTSGASTGGSFTQLPASPTPVDANSMSRIEKEMEEAIWKAFQDELKRN